MTAILTIRNLFHRYDQGPWVLRDFCLEVSRGEILCLLGPSGCGKTTALRLLAGFEVPHRGTVIIAGQQVSGGARFVPPEKRRLGIMFQESALFPHLNAAANVGFGLRGYSKSRKRRRVTELLELVALTGLGHRYPHELSGGQRQRIALARALAPEPELVLLDEPFSNLDTDLRRSLSSEVRRILKQSGLSAVLVTHDQEEAFAMADRIAVMNEGNIAQSGSAESLFHYPANRFVAGFVAKGSFVPGTVVPGTVVPGTVVPGTVVPGTVVSNSKVNPLGVRTELGRAVLLNDEGSLPGDAVEVLLRPSHLAIDESSSVRGRVLDIRFHGSRNLVTLTLASGCRIELFHHAAPTFKPGDSIGLRLIADGLNAFHPT